MHSNEMLRFMVQAFQDPLSTVAAPMMQRARPRGILSTNISMFTLKVLIGSAYFEIISTLTQCTQAKMCWKNC